MKICTHCNQVYPTHKLSCKKTNPEYRLPTADEFRTIKMLDSSHVWTDEKIMIEFAKLHVEAALKYASENADMDTEYYNSLQEGSSGGIDKDSILNSYPLDKIK